MRFTRVIIGLGLFLNVFYCQAQESAEAGTYIIKDNYVFRISWEKADQRSDTMEGYVAVYDTVLVCHGSNQYPVLFSVFRKKDPFTPHNLKKTINGNVYLPLDSLTRDTLISCSRVSEFKIVKDKHFNVYLGVWEYMVDFSKVGEVILKGNPAFEASFVVKNDVYVRPIDGCGLTIYIGRIETLLSEYESKDQLHIDGTEWFWAIVKE